MSAGPHFLQSARGANPCLSLLALVIPGISWFMATSLPSLHPSSHGLLFSLSPPPLCFEKILVIGLRAHPHSSEYSHVDPALNHICKSSFQIRSQSLGTYLLGSLHSTHDRQVVNMCYLSQLHVLGHAFLSLRYRSFESCVHIRYLFYKNKTKNQQKTKTTKKPRKGPMYSPHCQLAAFCATPGNSHLHSDFGSCSMAETTNAGTTSCKRSHFSRIWQFLWKVFAYRCYFPFNCEKYCS